MQMLIFLILFYTDSSLHAGAVYYYMDTFGNGYYNIKGNTFSEISTNKSVLVLLGTFSSLLFSYNTFYNVSSKNEGGVFLFYFIFFIILYFIIKAIYVSYSTANSNFEKCCFYNCSGSKGFIYLFI
jgi:hypothetical protein